MSKARDLANAGTALTTVSATELGYLDGVTSAVQTQIDSKIGQSTAINPAIVDAKGDIIAASAADTVARLAVGANDTVLTADSSTATGLKWATPAAGGMTLLATTTPSGTSTVVSSISQSYKQLYVVGTGITQNSNGLFIINPNSVASNIEVGGVKNFNGTATASQETTLAPMTTGQVTSSSTNGFALFIDNYTSTNNKPISYYGRHATGSYTTNFAGASTHTAAITSLQYTFTNGTTTFTGGTIYLYGVN